MKEDWINIIANDLAINSKNAIVDGPFGTQLKIGEFKKEGIPVIEMDNIKNDFFKSEFRRYVDYDKYDQIKRSTVKPGDLLISKTGSLGYVAFATETFDKAVITSRLAKLSLKWDFLLPQYFKYWLIHLRSIGYWENIATGTTMKILGISHLKNIPIPLCPLPIQRAIVLKIENQFTSLDKGIVDLKKAQEQLKIYRQAVLKKAFEGEFTKGWRENQNQLSTASEIIKQINHNRQKNYELQLEEWKNIVKNCNSNCVKESKPVKPQKPTNLSDKISSSEDLTNEIQIPADWSIVSLAWLSDNQPNAIVDGPFGSSVNVTEDYKEVGVPVIRMVNIRPLKFISDNLKFIIEDKFQQLKRHNILSGDILIAKVGATIGDCCIYPNNMPEAMLSTTGCCRIRLDSTIFLNKLLEYYILYQRFKLKRIASQTAQPFLNMVVVKAFPIPFLTKEEQHQVLREIESRLSVCDKVEQILSDSLIETEGLRISILKKAFDGDLLRQDEIVKCKQEPDYEPASELIKKIKAERKK